MLEQAQGDLLKAPAAALVNPVNTQGVMGKGLALQFRRAFPECFLAYKAACKAGEVQVGTMHVFARSGAPRFIINFPTQRHWRQPSRLESVREGLSDLVVQVRAHAIESLAIPPLGCGLGGLDWADVLPVVEAAFAEIPEVRVLVYAPFISR